MAKAFLPAVLQLPSRIVAWQFTLMAVLCLLVSAGWGSRTGVSFLSGELAGWLPTCLLVRVVFSRFLSAGSFLGVFFAAEMMRLLLTATLFVVVIQCLPVDVVPALAGLLSVVLAFWTSSLFCMGKAS